MYIPKDLGLQPQVLHQFQREINFKSDYAAYKEIKKLIKDFNPDIVHTHASKAGAIGRLAAAHCKVPIIVHTFHGHVFHSYFGKLKTNFYLLVERYLAKKSTAIVAISNKQKQELTDTFNIAPPNKFHVIPLGFDLERFTINKEINRKEFRAKYQLADDTIAIGIIGRLAPIKNHELFIEAISHLKRNNAPAFKAFVIGDGETMLLIKEYCKKHGVTFSENEKQQADVIFTSWIKQVDWALHGLDIVALTSLNEGTPVSIIEAQAAGKYVVATNVGGIEDVLHPECGLLSEVTDRETYFKNLLLACQNYSINNAPADKGVKWALEKFSYIRLVNDMRTLYDSLITHYSKG